MNKNYIVKRSLAYFIDMLIATILVFCISNIKFLNPMYEDNNKNSDVYISYTTSYTKMTYLFDNYFKDKTISKEEYDELIKDNNNFKYLLEESYDDENISEEEYEDIKSKVINSYNNEYKDIFYNYEHSCLFYYITYIIIFVLYFVFFNWYTKGQTLGKKLLKLKIVNQKDESPSILNLFIRSLILYNLAFYVIRIILLIVVSSNSFMDVFKIFNIIENTYTYIILFSILLSKEYVGLQDRLSKTKVIDLK